MKYKIEKNIPIPYPMTAESKKRKRRSKYLDVFPFADMEPGDSFFCEMSMGKTPHTIKKKAARLRKRLKTALDAFNEQKGGEPMRIVVRTYLKGVRVWRR